MHELGGRCAGHARLVRPSCVGGWHASQATMCWGGEARPVRPPCAGGCGAPVRLGRSAVVCWEGVVPGMRWCQAGNAARQAMLPGRQNRSGHHVHELGGRCASQSRPVRPSYAGGGAPGRQGRQAGEAARQVRLPGRRGRSGHYVHELGGGAPRRSGEANMPPCAAGVVRRSSEAGQASMCRS